MVPRKERPSPEELVGYKPPTPDTNYDEYDGISIRQQRGFWLTDWRRKQEEKRTNADGKEPLPGHEESRAIPSGRQPFDPTAGSLEQMVHSLRRPK